MVKRWLMGAPLLFDRRVTAREELTYSTRCAVAVHCGASENEPIFHWIARAHFSPPVRITWAFGISSWREPCFEVARVPRLGRGWGRTTCNKVEIAGFRVPGYLEAAFFYSAACVACPLHPDTPDSFALTLQILWRECLPKTPRLAGCGATSPLFFCAAVIASARRAASPSAQKCRNQPASVHADQNPQPSRPPHRLSTRSRLQRWRACAAHLPVPVVS